MLPPNNAAAYLCVREIEHKNICVRLLGIAKRAATDVHQTMACCLLCRENNVEQVVLEGVPGYASILVKAYFVYAAAGTQPFALVVTGDFQGSLTQLDNGGSGTCQVIVAGMHNPCLRFAVLPGGDALGSAS